MPFALNVECSCANYTKLYIVWWWWWFVSHIGTRKCTSTGTNKSFQWSRAMHISILQWIVQLGSHNCPAWQVAENTDKLKLYCTCCLIFWNLKPSPNQTIPNQYSSHFRLTGSQRVNCQHCQVDQWGFLNRAAMNNSSIYPDWKACLCKARTLC